MPSGWHSSIRSWFTPVVTARWGLNYQSYKPWLRDEFQFRCVYCLWRERWHSVGEDAFSVEHLQARGSTRAHLRLRQSRLCLLPL